MSENRRNRRNKKSNKVPSVKNSITKKDKIIWISILIVVIVLIFFLAIPKVLYIYLINYNFKCNVIAED